jgi:hypothetical protein
MEENFRQLLSTKQSIEEELRKYSNAGQDFHRIVSDYQALLGDIANVRRDLSMLQQK